MSVSIEGRNRKRWTGRGLVRGALIWMGSEELAFHSKSDTRSPEIFSDSFGFVSEKPWLLCVR